MSPRTTLYALLAASRGGVPCLTDMGWLIGEGFTCVNSALGCHVLFRVTLSVEGGTRTGSEHDWRDREPEASTEQLSGKRWPFRYAEKQKSTRCVTAEPRRWRRERRELCQGKTVALCKSRNFH